MSKIPSLIRNVSEESLLPSTIKEIESAAAIIRLGGVVIFPTDTVYGIGASSDSKKSIERIYQIKGTPKSQAFPLLISDVGQVRNKAKITLSAEKLIEKHWPGALTIILESLDGREKIGFRLPNSLLVRILIEKVTVPIIGTSANFHGKRTANSFDNLDPEFSKLADYTIEGECKLGVESTVVDASVDPPKVIREGAVTI